MIVPLDLPGVTVENQIKKLGMKSSDTAQVFFENVRIPQRFRIGEEGMGFAMQMMQFQEERISCGGGCTESLEELYQQHHRILQRAEDIRNAID